METDLYLIRSSKGYGYIGIRQDRLCRVYIPVITKAEVLDITAGSNLLDPDCHPLAKKVAGLIEDYFQGQDVDFAQIPLDLDHRTQFQRDTYQKLQENYWQLL